MTSLPCYQSKLISSQQGGTQNTPISAIPAAIAQDTSLLLGIWCSAGQDIVTNEIAALKAAIEQYGEEFTSRVTGLSVGSEDLYRISVQGIKNKSGLGVGPDVLVNYINQVKEALQGTALENVPIGHVDTWNDWVNGSNSAVVDAVDWLGFDGYPYFESSIDNEIENSETLFFNSLDATIAAAKGKDVWVTETGWPVSGPESGKAIASTTNARKFWEAVACKIVGKFNTYWYTLQDAYPVVPAPSFGVVGTELSTTPLYDLSCPAGGDDDTTTTATSGTSTTVAPTSTGGAGSGSGSETSVTDDAEPSETQTTVIRVPSGTASTSNVASDIGYPTGGPGGGSGNNDTVPAPTAGPSPTDGAPAPDFTGAAVKMAAPVMGALGVVLAAFL